MVRYLFYTIGDLTYQSPLVFSTFKSVDTNVKTFVVGPQKVSNEQNTLLSEVNKLTIYLLVIAGYVQLDTRVYFVITYCFKAVNQTSDDLY